MFSQGYLGVGDIRNTVFIMAGGGGKARGEAETIKPHSAMINNSHSQVIEYFSMTNDIGLKSTQ